ncbi:DNA-directed RNA polymerase subunit P [Candidatus Micrarchaeota archaeon CG10_big_fil_rev_8_21_14_0_10_45_29]|nr:MAG: DNA-directed RNA polymerase subunit P [Candidatus Micrarchaeota archaeon CG10_big_fil_rev_8_21_14_0_10_45_29]
MYTCSKCKKETQVLEAKFTRCQYCGCRELYKTRQPIAKEVSTD